jgi:8-oxo-dGTP pyrophosphatase MutT (NUDIX family)
MPKPNNPDKQKYMFADDIKFFQKVIIIHPHNKEAFLAIKRSASDRNRPDCWDLPGGNVGYGEKHDVSLKREVKEEVNLEIDHLQPLHVITNYENDIYYLFIGYKATPSYDLVTLSSEHTEYKWVTKEEFMELKSADFLIEFVRLL